MILFRFPGIKKVRCMFLGRSGKSKNGFSGNFSFEVGDSAENVKSVRANLLKELKRRGAYGWAECRQMHGNELLHISVPSAIFADPQNLPCADGMMTSQPGLSLFIKTADCQPVLLAHKSGDYIMALHIGWRGNQIEFIPEAVKNFCHFYAIKPADLYACRGPSLGPEHAEFINFAREWHPKFKPWFNEGTGRMNLWNLTRDQLCEAGLFLQNIYGMDICTYENSDSWFSYRKEKITGRQVSLIWIEKMAAKKGNGI